MRGKGRGRSACKGHGAGLAGCQCTGMAARQLHSAAVPVACGHACRVPSPGPCPMHLPPALTCKPGQAGACRGRGSAAGGGRHMAEGRSGVQPAGSGHQAGLSIAPASPAPRCPKLHSARPCTRTWPATLLIAHRIWPVCSIRGCVMFSTKLRVALGTCVGQAGWLSTKDCPCETAGLHASPPSPAWQPSRGSQPGQAATELQRLVPMEWCSPRALPPPGPAPQPTGDIASRYTPSATPLFE